MAKYHVLYNKKSGPTGENVRLDSLASFYEGDELDFVNILELEDYEAYFSRFMPQDALILVGGDGTINQFINRTKHISIANPIYYYAAGIGNDFLRDIGGRDDEAPVLLDSYIKKLPTATINGNTYFYINCVGMGIDGYCCEMGEEYKAKFTKPVNYTGIAVSGILFKYKPCDCKVTVDGVEHYFKKVWLAPTMNGRFYGGGMMATPDQDRLNAEGTQSVMIYHGKGKLKILFAFPSIFKGKHTKYNKSVTILTGKHIVMEYSSPRSLQIDGETMKNVSKYEINAHLA